MRVIIQRVRLSSVSIGSEQIAAISKGLLIFLGVETNDTIETVKALVKKLVGLRIFEDSDRKMNLSNEDVKGEYLVVSQFTLCADLTKGKRPGFECAMKPPQSEELFKSFCQELARSSSCPVKTGLFGESMLVQIENDGPATFVLEIHK